MLEELREQTPVGLFDVMRIKGVGAKRGRTLYKELGIDSLEKLEEAAAAGSAGGAPRLRRQDGGEDPGGRRLRAVHARAAALLPGGGGRPRRCWSWWKGSPASIRASSAGQVRRRLEVIDSIDMVAASEDPETVLAAFRALQGVERADDDDADRRAEVALRGRGAAPRSSACRRPRIPPRCVFATGSDAHLAQLARAGGDAEAAAGARTASTRERGGGRSRTRQAVYKVLGLDFIPPGAARGVGGDRGRGGGEAAEAGGGGRPARHLPLPHDVLRRPRVRRGDGGGGAGAGVALPGDRGPLAVRRVRGRAARGRGAPPAPRDRRVERGARGKGEEALPPVQGDRVRHPGQRQPGLPRRRAARVRLRGRLRPQQLRAAGEGADGAADPGGLQPPHHHAGARHGPAAAQAQRLRGGRAGGDRRGGGARHLCGDQRRSAPAGRGLGERALRRGKGRAGPHQPRRALHGRAGERGVRGERGAQGVAHARRRC